MKKTERVQTKMTTTRRKTELKSNDGESDGDVLVSETMAAAKTTTTDPGLPADLDKLRSVLLSDLALSINSLLKKALEDALAPLVTSLEQVKTSFNTLEERTKNVEEDLNDYSDRLVTIEAAFAELKAENDKLKDKVDDLENRSRRNNLRVVGIPEGAEGADPVKFMTDFFEEVLGKDFFQRPLILSRAHRLGRKPEDQSGSQRPRVFIVNFHYFQDKHRISTRRRTPLRFREHNVFFHEDVSAYLGKKQAAFKDVKTLLWKKNVRFAMVYPARLRVIHDGQTRLFHTPEEAKEYYNLHWGE